MPGTLSIATHRRRLQVAVRSSPVGTELYNYIDHREDQGAAATARLAMPNQPTTADTIAIGADTYEFVDTDGNVADDANIAVEIGASAADTRDNLIAAVNAADANNQHANINNVADTAPALANGTESLVADEVGTSVRIRTADYPGGPVAAADPSIVLAEAITDAADVWLEGNVDLNTLGGRAQGDRRRGVATVTVTAAMITNTAQVDFPFTPTAFRVQVRTSAGVVRGTTGTDTFTIANGGILVTFGGGAAPDIQATDIVQVEAWE